MNIKVQHSCLYRSGIGLRAFIDLEKAYDSVWMNGLVYKLSKGVKGRLWSWMNNFPADRTETCFIDGTKGSIFTIEVSRPQGSSFKICSGVRCGGWV